MSLLRRGQLRQLRRRLQAYGDDVRSPWRPVNCAGVVGAAASDDVEVVATRSAMEQHHQGEDHSTTAPPFGLRVKRPVAAGSVLVQVRCDSESVVSINAPWRGILSPRSDAETAASRQLVARQINAALHIGQSRSSHPFAWVSHLLHSSATSKEEGADGGKVAEPSPFVSPRLEPHRHITLSSEWQRLIFQLNQDARYARRWTSVVSQRSAVWALNCGLQRTVAVHHGDIIAAAVMKVKGGGNHHTVRKERVAGAEGGRAGAPDRDDHALDAVPLDASRDIRPLHHAEVCLVPLVSLCVPVWPQAGGNVARAPRADVISSFPVEGDRDNVGLTLQRWLPPADADGSRRSDSRGQEDRTWTEKAWTLTASHNLAAGDALRLTFPVPMPLFPSYLPETAWLVPLSSPPPSTDRPRAAGARRLAAAARDAARDFGDLRYLGAWR